MDAPNSNIHFAYAIIDSICICINFEMCACENKAIGKQRQHANSY